MPPRLLALVPAAGRGERFDGPLPKLLTPVGGRPLLAWTVEHLLASEAATVTVAVAADLLAEAPERILAHPRLLWVAGGATRQESVANCLEATPGAADDLILVHDGARPATDPADLAAVIAAAKESVSGAILGRPLGDTLKRVEGGVVAGTIERRGLFRAETPQIFPRSILAQALERAALERRRGTDEAALVEQLPGARIRAVVARFPNPKLTESGDLALIEALVLAGAAATRGPS